MRTITVSAEHIKNGVPSCGNQCPIALAISEQLNTDEVNVSSRTARIDGKDYLLPLNARFLISEFDESRDSYGNVYFEVKPITFELGEPLSEKEAEKFYTLGNTLEV